MPYNVEYGSLKFRAAFFEFKQTHPSDVSGMPGRGDTQITMRLWVISGDDYNMESKVRTALFEYANFYRGDDKNVPQLLSVEVELNLGEGKHRYTIDNAWLESYKEFQETTYAPDFTEVTLKRLEPNTTERIRADVVKGEASAEVRMELLFRGFIQEGKGSGIESVAAK
jgi:hypothetical protein